MKRLFLDRYACEEQAKKKPGVLESVSVMHTKRMLQVEWVAMWSRCGGGGWVGGRSLGGYLEGDWGYVGVRGHSGSREHGVRVNTTGGSGREDRADESCGVHGVYSGCYAARVTSN